jgi:hypothetical protein
VEINDRSLNAGRRRPHRRDSFLRSAGSRHLLPRGFDGGLSFAGRKCRVRPPIVTIKKLHIQNLIS